MPLQEIEFRTVDYSSDTELRTYSRLFWNIPLEHNAYFTCRSESFLDDYVATARQTEDAGNTFSGIALHQGEIVGLHLVRRYEEWEQVGVHIAGLWVHPEYRGIGIARTLKNQGETWARSIGATFINANIQAGNRRMLKISEQAGFSLFRFNMRKRL
ncbi:MAG: GNAT family N-acetyltransferase [Chthoniobacter sp.]